MDQYKKKPPTIGLSKPETKALITKTTPSGELKKPKEKDTFDPPPPLWTREVKKEIQEFVLCPKDCFVNLFGCDTKAYHCPSNCTSDGCTCDQVCQDSDCSRNCDPNCRCDSKCYDCSDCGDCGHYHASLFC